MTNPYDHRIGLLADPHVHATHIPGIDGPALRPLAEVMASSRVYNESVPAMRAALDGMARQGVTLVLILGDLTDDGQETDLRTARTILAEYEARGMRFLMVPGNHDMFGMRGRHQTQGYVVDGKVQRRSSMAGAELMDAGMRTLGYPEALGLLHGLGFTPDPRDLYWESPFGTASWVGRTYGQGQIDASYLVEPVEGLWILSLDANHFVEGAALGAIEALDDPNHQGWGPVLRDRPYLADWMTDVAQRARDGGKRLIAMSHYPMLEPADRVLALDLPLHMRDSAPDAARTGVAEALRLTGIGRVVTAHYHVNADVRLGGPDGRVLTNHAVPSTVTWPGAYRTLGPEGIVTHPVRPAVFADGDPYGGALPMEDYGAFLKAHYDRQLDRRYYAKEWPLPALQALKDANFGQLFPQSAGLSDLPARVAADDWYHLRKGAPIPPDRLRLYRRLADDPLTALTRRLADFARIYSAAE